MAEALGEAMQARGGPGRSAARRGCSHAAWSCKSLSAKGREKRCRGQLDTREKAGEGFSPGANGELHNGVCASKLYLTNK